MMDYRAVGLEGFVGPNNRSSSQPVSDSETTKQKINGSGFLTQHGSGSLKQHGSGSGQDEYWRASKVGRTVDSESPKTVFGTSLLMRSNSGQQQHQNMISFSSPKSESPLLNENGGFAERNTQNSDSQYFQHTPCAYTRNGGIFFPKAEI